MIEQYLQHAALGSALSSRRMRVSNYAWGLALSCAGALAADPRPDAAVPTLSSAVAQLQNGDAAGAAKSLKAITAADPNNDKAWRALAASETALQHYDTAIAAYRRALAIQPDSPWVFYQLGTVYAAKQDTQHAFEWLGKAKATHRYDMSEISADAHLAGLRMDPRFNGLLPSAADFEHPFVEPVKIIREWRGEAAGDQFGWIARNVGDVDGDGIPDIVTSAPTHGGHTGRIYVYSVGTGRLLWSADGKPGDELGSGVEGIGDANGDGIPDVAASGPTGTGVAYIYSGRDGKILQSFKSARNDELFGNHISGIGDIDGDGHADIVVGAPGKPGESTNPGHAYVFSGKDGRLLYTLSGERPGDDFGSAVTGHSKGKQHILIVGAPRAGPDHHGRLNVYDNPTGAPKFVVEADATGNALGAMFVSFLGGSRKAGTPDVFVSDWSNTAKGPSTGRIYVQSGSTGERLLTLTGETAGEGFGTSKSTAGDVDGDGREDLIVGAWQYAGAALSGGRAYLYSGKDGRLIKTFTCRTPGDTFGFDAVGLGDVDHDGTADLLVTSGWSAVNGHHSGRVFIISSGVKRERNSLGSTP
ncbi:MAG TPA: FG-GAP-like repeat-containing protein [Steroidobacteraceae bacterium]